MASEKRLTILYFGNKLHLHGKTKTMMEKLEPKLSEWNTVIAVSNKKNTVWRALDFLLTFLKYARTSDRIIIDVYSTLNFWYAVALSILCKLFAKQYILYLHGGNLPKRFEQSAKIFSFILRNAQYRIAPSSYLADYFTEKKYSTNIIPNFIEQSQYRFQTRIPHPPKLLYLRGFGEAYNPLMLLKAIESLKSGLPEIHVTMVGKADEPNYKNCIDYITNHNLEKHIHITPPLDFENWTAIANSCNFMISTTYTDNLPVSVIEGMALGLLVIATNVGGVPKLINDGVNGILVESDNAEQLAEAILNIQSDTKAYNEIIENARNTAGKYDWSEIKPIWEELLNHSK